MERKQLYTIQFTAPFTGDTVHTIKLFESSLHDAWSLAREIGEVPDDMMKAGYGFTHDINIVQEDVVSPVELWLHPIRLVKDSNTHMLSLDSSLDDRIQGKVISIHSEQYDDEVDE